MAGDAQKDDAQQGGWYKGTDGQHEVLAPVAGLGAVAPDAAEDDAVEWTASEFVAHDKGFGWFALLTLFALVAAGLLYLITRDIFSAVVVLVMAVILGIAGARKPRVISYRLDPSGLTAGKQFYPYREYKSFAMPDDGPFTSVVLVPMKRFGFPANAYLAPDSQEKALRILSNHLPMERGQMDAVEKLMRQLRF